MAVKVPRQLTFLSLLCELVSSTKTFFSFFQLFIFREREGWGQPWWDCTKRKKNNFQIPSNLGDFAKILVQLVKNILVSV